MKMKKLMFLSAISCLFFLTSCAGLQFTVGVGVGGTVGGSAGGGGQYPTQQGQQQPCGSYGNGGYYGYQNPNPPVITTPGVHR